MFGTQMSANGRFRAIRVLYSETGIARWLFTYTCVGAQMEIYPVIVAWVAALMSALGAGICTSGQSFRDSGRNPRRRRIRPSNYVEAKGCVTFARPVIDGNVDLGSRASSASVRGLCGFKTDQCGRQAASAPAGAADAGRYRMSRGTARPFRGKQPRLRRPCHSAQAKAGCCTPESTQSRAPAGCRALSMCHQPYNAAPLLLSPGSPAVVQGGRRSASNIPVRGPKGLFVALRVPQIRANSCHPQRRLL